MVKCDSCHLEMRFACYAIAYFGGNQQPLEFNVCARCLSAALGPAGRRKLDAAMGRSGWRPGVVVGIGNFRFRLL